MNKVFSLCACILGITYLLLGQAVMAQSDPNMRDRMEQRRDAKTNSSQDSRQDPRSTKLDAPVGPKVTLCPGEYAFCSSSTCKPTGRKIKVKVDGGKKNHLRSKGFFGFELDLKRISRTIFFLSSYLFNGMN
jgi:hypothetical protein